MGGALLLLQVFGQNVTIEPFYIGDRVPGRNIKKSHEF